MRVAGPPFDTATSLVTGTTANTVFWYTGENGATPALQTATAQVGPSMTIAYGMRANEQAISTLVANVAVLAATTYSASDPNAQSELPGAHARRSPRISTVSRARSRSATSKPTSPTRRRP